jgi:hypothetical protein
MDFEDCFGAFSESTPMGFAVAQDADKEISAIFAEYCEEKNCRPEDVEVILHRAVSSWGKHFGDKRRKEAGG